MLDKKLKEALELLGGRAILKDQNEYFVLLTLKEFRKIALSEVEGLTKQELVDKINNDIAGWKSAQEEQKIEEIDLAAVQEKKSEEIHYERAS